MHPFAALMPARVVAVTGDDRLRYLHDVTTQAFLDLVPGQSRSALVLDGRGQVTGMFDAVGLADRTLLVAPTPDVAEALVETLGSRTFLLDARFALTDLEVVAVRGAPVPPLDGVVTSLDQPEGVDLVVEDGAAALELLAGEGIGTGTEADVERSRILAGVPAWGTEIARPHLPQEMGLLPTHVHLDKGCYPGQETVAKMWTLGGPRRRLAVVEVHGDEQNGVRLTSVVDATDGHQVGLAYVPPDSQAGARVGAVTVVRLVGEGLDIAGAHPPTRRRSLL